MGLAITLVIDNDEMSDLYNILNNGRKRMNHSDQTACRKWCDNLSAKYRSTDRYQMVFKGRNIDILYDATIMYLRHHGAGTRAQNDMCKMINRHIRDTLQGGNAGSRSHFNIDMERASHRLREGDRVREENEHLERDRDQQHTADEAHRLEIQIAEEHAREEENQRRRLHEREQEAEQERIRLERIMLDSRAASVVLGILVLMLTTQAGILMMRMGMMDGNHYSKDRRTFWSVQCITVDKTIN